MIAWTPFTLGGAGAKTAICLIPSTHNRLHDLEIFRGGKKAPHTSRPRDKVLSVRHTSGCGRYHKLTSVAIRQKRPPPGLRPFMSVSTNEVSSRSAAPLTSCSPSTAASKVYS